VENNHFQALVHLSLKFREATDQILKNYLAHRLSNEKGQNEELRIKIERLDEGLTHKASELERAQIELRRFNEEKERVINELINEEKRKINETKEISIEKESNLLKTFEQEKRETATNYEKTIRELQIRTENLTKNNQNLTEAKIELEAKERELSGKVKTYERENNLLQSQIDNIRVDNRGLDKMRFDHEKLLAELKVKCESLETQLRNKEDVIQKHVELSDNSGKQRSLIEENLVEAKKKIEKLEQKCNSCCDEINKGNEVIEKLEKDAKDQKQKLKIKNALVIQQEETINKHQETMDKLNKAITDLQRECQNREFSVKDLHNNNDDLKNKLNESLKTIEDNQNMIRYLNQCLNESQKPSGVRMPFTNKYAGGTTTQSGYSPYKAYGGGDGDFGTSVGGSLKYSTSVNVDKYKQYSNNMESNNFSGTGTTPLTFSKTLGGTLGGTNFSDKAAMTADFERDNMNNFNKVSTLSNMYDGVKENVDYTNRSMTSMNPLTTHKTHNITGNEFTSTSSIDISAYGRNIQPIKYHDPNK
jgi:chromosome segregation ATPase